MRDKLTVEHDSTMQRPTYLYVLLNSAGDAFKIGVSVDTTRRIAALPQSIDVQRSYQYEITTGDAFKAERTLHYLFREHAAKQPFGAGYTEWFDIAALPAVLAFAEQHRDSLGLGKKRGLDVRRCEADAQRQIDREARRLAAETREAARAQARLARAHRASAHNRETLSRIEHFVAQCGALTTILHYRESTYLYLPAEHENWMEQFTGVDTRYFYTLLHRVGGEWTIFSGYFKGEGATHMQLHLSTRFMCADDGDLDEFPYARDLRAILHSKVASLDAVPPELRRCHTRLCRESLLFSRRWHRAWLSDD